MTAIALIEAIATLLWSYTALTLLAWITHTARLDRSHHVAALTDLITHLVPAMIGLVALVLIGAFIGLPSVVAFIAILFPAGTAYATHMALTEARDAPLNRADLPRLAATLAFAMALIAYRQTS